MSDCIMLCTVLFMIIPLTGCFKLKVRGRESLKTGYFTSKARSIFLEHVLIHAMAIYSESFEARR